MGYSLKTVWSCSILRRNRKAISGSGSCLRKEMEQDCAGIREDCGSDGKCCRTGQSQKLDHSAYAAESHGKHASKAFYWEVTLSLLHNSWSILDTVLSTEATRVV